MQNDVPRLIQIVVDVLDTQILVREKSTSDLAGIFTKWLDAKAQQLHESCDLGRPLRILTLSHSSSLYSCLPHAIKTISSPSVSLHPRISTAV
jgi:hypothetical protein